MATLADCLKKAGRAVSVEDQEAIYALVDAGIDEVQAVTTVLGEARTEITAVANMITVAGGNVTRVTKTAINSGTIEPGGTNEQSEPQLAQDGGTALEGASAETAPVPQGEGGAGRVPGRSGRANDQRNERDDAGRGDQAGGVGGNQGPVSDTATGKPRVESPATAGEDYHLTDEDLSGFGGAKTRARANMDAIRLLKRIEGEGRGATTAEQRTLARYVGWGGLKQIFNKNDKGWAKDYAELKELLTDEEYKAANRSVLNAHFTSPDVIHGIYRGVQGLGVQASKILEPAVGTGNFIGLKPSSLNKAKFTAIELDSLTGRMTKLLYPKAKVHVQGFQTFTSPDNYFDVVIGNPPFGNEKLYDPKRKEASKHSIHNFFFIKSLEVTRPGGVVAMVVSNSLLDSSNMAARQAMAERARFLGAVRLPNNAFKENAGTEVTTDIIFFQKLAEGEQADSTWAATATIDDPLGGDTMRVGSWFAKNPDMIIGRMERAGTMYRADATAAIWDGEGDFTALLNERIDKIVEQNKEAFANDQAADTSKIDEAVIAELDPKDVTAKVHGFFVDPFGNIRQRDPDMLGAVHSTQLDLSKGLKERYSAFIELRDLLRAQLSKEMTDEPGVEANRKKLNRAYNAFKKKYGYVNKTYNRTQFLSDPDYPLVASLEQDYTPAVSAKQAAARNIDPTKEGAKKGAILLRRVREPHTGIKRVNTSHDALLASLAERGQIDRNYIESIYTQKSFDETMAELGDLVYQATDGESWLPRDEYLSGNVKAKLIDAQEAAALSPEIYQRNVDALQEAQPAEVPPEKITVKFGTNWVPNEMYEDFIKHLLGMTGGVTIRQFPTTASVSVDINSWQANWTAKTETWGTRDMPADKIIDKAMNAKPLTVYDRIPDGGSAVNPQKTAAANRKLDAIRREFSTWLFSDVDRRETAVKLWNDRFNNTRDRIFDGSHLGTDGKGNEVPMHGQSANIILREHQKNFVWRFIQTGKALADHVVGAGKTWAAIAGVMERKRLGLIKKPMFVVPNHLVLQWQNDFLALYPGARILSATKNDFAGPKRRAFLARAATGDYDAIIIAHSSFKFIPVPTEYKNRFIQDQIADYKAALEIAKEGGRGAVRDIQNAIAKLEEKLDKAHDEQAKDTVVNFEEMGVDALIVDESHEYKNLRFGTSRGRDVQGLGAGASSPSARADDMFIKTQFILEKNNNKNLMFLTGTPISNSATELYTLQRYMDNQRLKDMGLGQFDSWFTEFAWDESKLEIDVSGQRLVPKTRLRKFVNVGPLMDMYREYADVVTRSMIDKARAAQGKPPLTPPIKGGKPQIVVIPATPGQAQYNANIIARMDKLKGAGKPEKGQDNMLSVSTDARKSAIDVRLVNPAAPDHENSKSSVVAKNVKTLYDKWDHVKGTQLVFLDMGTPKGLNTDATRRVNELMERVQNGDEAAAAELEKVPAQDRIDALTDFDLYNDLRDKLIKSGIPADEVAFIHQAKTDQQKFALIRKVNSGAVRVLIGSTGKMSTGMNAQRRLVALHHMDVPYRPSDVEQREGRIIRQGNELYEGNEVRNIAPIEGFEIEIYRYAQETTFDSTMWQKQEDKAIIVEQAKSGAVRGDIEGDISGEMTASEMASEMKALASGDPRIMEQVRLAHELQILEVERQEWLSSKFRMQSHLKQTARYEEEAAEAREVVERDIERRVDPPKGEFAGITVNGVKYTNKKKGGEALVAQLLQARKLVTQDKKVADYRGFPVNVETDSKDGSLYMMIEAEHDVYPSMWAPGAKVTPAGTLSRLDNILSKFDDALFNIEDRRTKTAATRWEAKRNVDKPFAGEAEYQEKKVRHDKLVDELSGAEEEKAAEGEDTEEAAASRRLDEYRKGATAAGLRVADIRKVIGRAVKAVSPILSVRVVQSVDDIPNNAVPSESEGAFFNSGGVFLVADNLTPNRIAPVFRHEVFGHAAPENHPEFRTWLADIQAARLKPGVVQDLAAEVARRQGLLDSETEAKEVIALMAERGIKHSILDRIIAAIRKVLRAAGLVTDVTEAEIRTMLSKSSRQFMSDAELAKQYPKLMVKDDAPDADILRTINTLYPTDAIDDKPLLSVRPAAIGGRAMGDDAVEDIIERRLVKHKEELGMADRIRLFWRTITDREEGRITQGLFDAGHAIKMMEKGMFGEMLDATDSAYKSFLAVNNLPSVMAAVMQKGAPTLVNGAFQVNEAHKGIIEIFRPITEHVDGNLMKQWELFAATNRASRLIGEKNEDGTPRENWFTQQEIDVGLALEEQYPIFREVLDGWAEFNSQILDMAVDAGVINPDARAIWENADYVPFYRLLDDGTITRPGNKGGIEGQRSGIKRLTGGEGQIDVFENMMMNTAHLIDASFKNLAMQRTTEMALEAGLMEKMPPQWRKRKVDNRQIEKRLNEEGIDLQLTAEERKQFSKLFISVQPEGPDVVSALWNGKRSYYRVNDPMLLSSVSAMGYDNMSKAMALLRVPKKWLTVGVTTSPEFMLANLIRDSLSTWVVSDVNKIPIVDSVKGLSATFKQDENIMAIMMAGAGGGGFYDSAPEDIRKLLEKKMPAKNVKGFLGTVLSPTTMAGKGWEFWQKVGASTENATRVAIFKSVIKNGGSVAEAAYQARDVLNFTMHGDYAMIRFLTQSVPFLNARLQGLYRLYRGFKENKAAFTMKGGMLLMATMALLFRNDDRDEYEEIPDWDKDVYWHIFLNAKGEPVGPLDHWRIPKPFEVGSLFGMVPERMVRKATGRDDWDTFGKRIGSMLSDTLAFNPIPQTAKPIIEQFANKSFFTNSPIVGLSLSHLEPEAQYTAWTSEFVKKFAEAMPDGAPAWMRSPKRLESGVRAYFGTLGTYVLSAADAAVAVSGDLPAKPTRKIYEMPIAKRFLRDPEPRYTKYSDQMYDMVKEANNLQSTINNYRQQGLLEKAQELQDKNINKLRVRKRLNKMVGAIRKLNNQQRMVMYSTKLTAEEKAERLDALTKKKNDITRQVAPFEEFF